jgi:hypothetical protein
MMESKTFFSKFILFLFVALMIISGNHTDLKVEDRAASLRLFAYARGEAAAPADESDQEAALQAQYDAAQALFDAQEYEKAYEAFGALGSFSNSRARARDSQRKWRAATYNKAVDLFDAGQYYEARPIFESLENYEKSRKYVYNCNMAILRSEYQQAEDLFDAGDYQGALTLFESLDRFRDSRDRAKAAADMVKAQEKAAEELRSYETAMALQEAGDLEGARDAFIEAGDCKDATDQLYAVLRRMALEAVYEQAESSFASGAYEDAFDGFAALADYQDSAEKASLAKASWHASLYEQAASLKNTSPSRAYLMFLFLGDYKDSAAHAKQLKTAATDQSVYAVANAMAQSGDYAQAKLGFETISPYGDSREQAEQLGETIRQVQAFKDASFLSAIGEKEQANAIFQALGDFHNAAERIVPIFPRFTTVQLRDDKTSPKSPVFIAPDGTRHRYQIYKGVHTWVEAKAFCEVLGGHLATLTTAEENAFVHGFMLDSGYNTAYFGLSDEKRTGDWIWVTGEPFVYTNWDSGEPSRSARERYGMYFYKHTTGTWNDSHFYETAKVDPGCSYICEWDE